MGLFSAIGKVLKGVSKVAGIIPGIGGTIKGITGAVGNLLDSKSPMSGTGAKISALGNTSVAVLRGKTGGALWQQMALAKMAKPSQSTPTLQAQSPVLPGGAIATASGGIMNAGGGTIGAVKRRKPAKRKKAKAKTKKRKTKLKFGSKAWRKKYLGHK